MAKSKKVRKTTRLPASKTDILHLLKKLETLQYIAYPYATFEPIRDYGDFEWKESEEYSFRFKVFGVIPLGIHTIKVRQFNCDEGLVYTHEGNRHVPVWNHRIILLELDDRETQYTDEIEIQAGWKTIFVMCWAQLFYAHRQKRWGKLLFKAESG